MKSKRAIEKTAELDEQRQLKRECKKQTASAVTTTAEAVPGPGLWGQDSDHPSSMGTRPGSSIRLC